MIADYHMHTLFSGDSEENPEKMIQRALFSDMHKMCFTDHQDFDYAYDEFDFMLDSDKYFDEISRLRDKYRGEIEISIGVEMGLEPHLYDKIDAFLKRHPYDFVIGSTHLIEGVDPYYPEYFKEYGDKGGFQKYFNYILETLDCCSNFDVYGHLDYIVRYAPEKDKNYSYEEFREIIDKILIKLIKMGKGIELNTGGLYKGMKSTNPHPDIIKRYKDLGGEVITVGSDSHKYEFIGYSFNEASEILTNAGFKYYTVFHNRKPEFVKI